MSEWAIDGLYFNIFLFPHNPKQKSMKLKLLFIMGIFCVFYNTLNAQPDSHKQILRESVSLKDLQEKIPTKIKQSIQNILILNQDVNFTLIKINC